MNERFDNIIRPSTAGNYYLNGKLYLCIGDVVSKALDLPLPEQRYRYTYSYHSPEWNEYRTLVTNTFDDVINAAFQYPNQFKCQNLNEEETEFIDSLMALKIAEKLEQ